MRSLHQQPAQVQVPFLGDAQLRLALARFAALRPQAHLAAHVAAFLKPAAIFQRQHERQSDPGSDSADLLHKSGFRILFPGDLLDVPVAFPDLRAHRFDLLQQR